MQIQSPHPANDDLLCAHELRRIHELASAGAAFARHGLAEHWSVERHEGCEGGVSLILLPRDDAGDAPTFQLSREAGGCRADAWWDEDGICLGFYPSASGAVGAVLDAVATCLAVRMQR